MKTITMLVISFMLVAASQISHATDRKIQFSDRWWTVRSSGSQTSGPGPNYWSNSTDNVWVDDNGYLHLKITHENGKWYCPEVITDGRFGLGAYQFWVIGAIDDFDPHVVFGMFQYPTPDIGSNGSHEVDFEFSTWGSCTSTSNALYTVYPNINPQGAIRVAGQEKWGFTLSGSNPWTTHRYTRTSSGILFQSQYGHYDDTTNLFHSWTYDAASDIFTAAPGDVNHSQDAMPVHLNLWCFGGSPAAPVEVVISKFKFTGM